MSNSSPTPEISEEEYHRIWKKEKDPDLSILRKLAYKIATLKGRDRSFKGKIDAAANQASLQVDCKTTRVNELFVCYTLVAGIKIGHAEGIKMKEARNNVYGDTIQKLLLPYLRIIQTSHDHKELEGSFQPFTSHDPADKCGESKSASTRETCDSVQYSSVIDNTMLQNNNSNSSKVSEISLDAFRDPTESTPEWQMRKEFLDMNVDSLPPDRLICLSKCFVNIYFSGCLYPRGVMNEIRERSHGLMDRKEKQEKARTLETYKNSFVRASNSSDYAPDTSSHTINNNDNNYSYSGKNVNNAKLERKNDKESNKRVSNFDLSEKDGPSESKRSKSDSHGKESERGNTMKAKMPDPVPTKKNATLQKNKKKQNLKESQNSKFTGKSIEELILFHNLAASSSHQILNESAGFSRMSIRFDYELDKSSQTSQSTCHVIIDNQIIASATGVSKAISKTEACDLALDKLRKLCWRIKVKRDIDSETIIAREEFFGGTPKSYEVPLKNSLVNKMMQKMGWTGGSLGKDGRGAVEPVSFTCSQSQTDDLGHEGLGFKPILDFDKAKITEFLQDYASDSNNTHDLVFSEDFSKQERQFIHSQCLKIHLRSKSRSKGPERRLVVGRKWTPSTLFTHIQNSGGETEKYVLIAPNTDLDKPLIIKGRDVKVSDNNSIKGHHSEDETSETEYRHFKSDKVEVVDMAHD